MFRKNNISSLTTLILGNNLINKDKFCDQGDNNDNKAKNLQNFFLLKMFIKANFFIFDTKKKLLISYKTCLFS